MQNSIAMMVNNLKVSKKFKTLTIYSLYSKTNLRDIKTRPYEDLYPCVCMIVLFIMDKHWKQFICTTTQWIKK